MLRRAVLALLPLLALGTAWAAGRPDAGADATARTAVNKPAKKNKKASRYAPVELFAINTKETLRLRFYDDAGKPIKGWQRRFDRFMRCHQTGKVFKMDRRLAQMLYQVGRRYEGHRLEIVSGYRHPKVAKNPKSPHKHGVACDFRVAGIANATLRDYLRATFAHAGVGYYPNSVFVHLDDRKLGPAAFWIDYSGPGEAAFYAENPGEDLRTGRAERMRRDDAAGRAEGGDETATAGRPLGAGGRAGNKSGGMPVEIRAPSDTFGD